MAVAVSGYLPVLAETDEAGPAGLVRGQDGAGGQGVHLAGGAAGGGLTAGDLPQGDSLALARALGDVQGDRGAGQVVVMRSAAVIGAGNLRERVGGQVGRRCFAVGEQVEPGAEDVREQGR